MKVVMLYEDVLNNMKTLKTKVVNTDEEAYFDIEMNVLLLLNKNIYEVNNIIYQIDELPEGIDCIEHILLKEVNKDAIFSS